MMSKNATPVYGLMVLTIAVVLAGGCTPVGSKRLPGLTRLSEFPDTLGD